MHRRNTYLSDRFKYVFDYNVRNTRNAMNNLLHLPKPRVEKFRQSFQYAGPVLYNSLPSNVKESNSTVQITFIFIDFRVCDFAFAFKTQNAPCVSRFKRVLFSDRFQFAF